MNIFLDFLAWLIIIIVGILFIMGSVWLLIFYPGPTIIIGLLILTPLFVWAGYRVSTK